MIKTCFLPAAIALALVTPAVADLAVPGDYDTIQEAIDDAVAGETILVAKGTYLERIDLLGKTITLLSAAGPGATTIDGSLASDCCTGHGGSGCDDASCQATVCAVDPFCCSASWDSACAIWAVYWCDECNGIGSAISCVTGEGPDTIIDGFTITGGTGSFVQGLGFAGGGMIAIESDPTVINCIFAGNSADYGGAVFNLLTDSVFINCTFSGNAAVFSGGGMYNGSSAPILINCTFSANVSISLGGGMYNGSSSPIVDNCIFWSNSDSGGTDETAQIHVHSDAATVNYSCIQGGWTGAGGTGNLDGDPLFADELGPDGTAGTGDEDLRLTGDSPCIDAGDNTAVPGDVTTDLEGNPRIAGGTVDMGAYETDDGTAPDPGTSDIVWHDQILGTVHLWLMDGTQKVGEGSVVTLDPTVWSIAGLGDLNGDRRCDILWRHLGSGLAYLYLMDGTQRIDQGTLVTLDPDVWTIVGLGDFNDDDRDDIVWRNLVTGQVYLHLMDGFERIDEGPVVTLPLAVWSIAGLGDLNGDGNCDILWRNQNTGLAWLYLMDGTQKIGQAKVVTLPIAVWSIAGLGDFNGDDRDDILWRNLSSGLAYLYLMDGNQKIGQGAVGVLPVATWSIAGLGDFNADRRCDILWRKVNTGQTWLYLMDGTQKIGQGAVGSMGPFWDIPGFGDFDGPE